MNARFTMLLIVSIVTAGLAMQHVRPAAESLSEAVFCCPDCTEMSCPVKKTLTAAPACHGEKAASSPYKLDHRCTRNSDKTFTSQEAILVDWIYSRIDSVSWNGTVGLNHAGFLISCPDSPPPKFS